MINLNVSLSTSSHARLNGEDILFKYIQGVPEMV